jgi:hypothetical protein
MICDKGERPEMTEDENIERQDENIEGQDKNRRLLGHS